jgi:hypothetical protein
MVRFGVINGADGPEIRLPLFPESGLKSDIGPCPVRAKLGNDKYSISSRWLWQRALAAR